MVISGLADVLTWSGGTEALEQVHAHYVDVVSEALGRVISAIAEQDPPFGDLLFNEIKTAESRALLRVLLAPETTNDLLWPTPETVRDTGEFLHRSLMAEAALEGQGEVESRTWTALGDAVVDPPAEVTPSPSVTGLMALDFDSPTVRRLDPLGVIDESSQWGPLSDGHREVVLERLHQAQQGIAATSDIVSRFITQFTKVLAVQSDNQQRSFSSYSNGHFIGRAVLSNPQLVDEVQVAEAMVHEAIHAFLYMQSQRYPWGIADPPAHHEPPVVSPWTQRKLPVSTYLHACFVWYGLLHFWSLALPTERFAARRVRGRIARAASGFLGAPLLDHVEEQWASVLDDDIKMAISELQRRVVESSAGVGSGVPFS